MSINNIIKNICTKLGNQSKATYPMIAIATANGIFRPTFTMMKKGENPESKKYAATRELITEVIAVPTYWISGEIAEKFAGKIVAKAMDIKFATMEKKGQILAENIKAEMKESAIKKGKAGLNLIGVCIAAGLIIPSLCSAFVTPIMNKLGTTTPNKNNNNLDIKENSVSKPAIPITQYQQINRPAFKNIYNSGMKVGGV